MTHDEIESLLASATPASEWTTHVGYGDDGVSAVGPLHADSEGVDTEPGSPAHQRAEADRALIAAAPTVIRELLDRVREVEAREQARGVIGFDVATCEWYAIPRSALNAVEAQAAMALAEFFRAVSFWSFRTARRHCNSWMDDYVKMHARAEAAERERDALKHHYDAAGPEHNLAALLDLYDERRRDAILALEAACEESDAAIRERDARPPLATLPTEHVCGEWIMSGQAEPDAVVTYASEPSPETGHVGWCWWARGKMGDARDYMAAREAAERSLRAHAGRGKGET